METSGGGSIGTTISAGTPVSVGAPASVETATPQGHQAEAVSAPEAKPVDSNKNINAEVEIKNDSIFADGLIKTAKEEGVDAAFEKLAAVDEEDGKPNNIVNLEDYRAGKKKSETEIEGKIDSENTKESKETVPQIPVEQRIKNLEAKISELSNESPAEPRRQVNVESPSVDPWALVYELAEIIKKLEEEKEEAKKKKGLLEILTRLLAKVLVLIMAGEEGEKEADKNSNKKREDQTALEQLIA